MHQVTCNAQVTLEETSSSGSLGCNMHYWAEKDFL